MKVLASMEAEGISDCWNTKARMAISARKPKVIIRRLVQVIIFDETPVAVLRFVFSDLE